MSTATPPARRPTLTPAAKKAPTGHIQTRIRRSLITAGRPLPTGELVRQIYPRPTQHWHYGSVREAAAKFAERVGYRASRGAPVLWKLREPKTN